MDDTAAGREVQGEGEKVLQVDGVPPRQTQGCRLQQDSSGRCITPREATAAQREGKSGAMPVADAVVKYPTQSRGSEEDRRSVEPTTPAPEGGVEMSRR